jgi:hypothetical protein
MDQLPFDTPKGGHGGDTRTPQAKVDIAKSENQVVELTHHRSELAKLEIEETRLWQALDSHKESWQATATCISGLNHVRGSTAPAPTRCLPKPP